MGVVIERGSPGSIEARRLIAELEVELDHYPDESQHGYSVEKLISEGVAFFLVEVDGEPVGCGGVQVYPAGYGELKRMYIRPAFRGRGLGKQLIDQLASHARDNGARCLRLETGIHQHEAIRLYERAGFVEIGPFGEYLLDPLSRFFELSI